jgi:N-acetylmuramoyl-L-alanine amidase CwlA
MSYTLHKDLKAKSISYGDSRAASSIKYIVFHYTGNKTDTAKANANYFATSNTRAAGAHYFVDDTTVYQSIDDLKIAYAVGGSKVSEGVAAGGGTLYGKCTNANSISIEMCSKNGVITDATIENVVTLAKTLMKKYNVDSDHLCTHFMVTGKSCPGWTGWIKKDLSKWNSLKAKLTSTTTSTKVTYKTVSYSVKVTASDGLNCRKEPDSKATKVKTYAYGTVLKITREQDGWGYTGEGWVSLSYTEKVSSEYKVKVTATSLNIRSGAGTSYSVVGTVSKDEVYTIVEEKNGFGKLKSGAGWISLSYVKKV